LDLSADGFHVMSFLPHRFGKWHSQQVVEIQFIRLGVCTYTNAYLFLVHIGKKGAQDSIPDGKNGTIICVPFFYDHGMVYPMHGRGYKKDPPQCFKPFGNRETAVMELGTK
jgi:hypothetical protein